MTNYSFQAKKARFRSSRNKGKFMRHWLAVKVTALGLMFSPLSLRAYDSCEMPCHHLSIGPEIYLMQRDKEQGAFQQGVMYGIRLQLDRIKRKGFYWGFEGLWAQGSLKGKLKADPSFSPDLSHLKVSDVKVKSCLTDANFEERLGFTFQTKNSYRLTFTPYLGLGYFWEYNHYELPKNSPFHFNNEFLYVPVGFFSQITLFSDLKIGLNFKLRVLIHGSQRVTNDSKYVDHDMNYEEKLQYRGEVPVTYNFCYKSYFLGINLTPFYEFRDYGSKINFPQDFYRTSYQLYGATGKFLFLF